MADAGSRSGHGYGTPEILGWLADLHAPHDAGLTRAFEAPERHGMPAIQLGISEAKLVEMLCVWPLRAGSWRSGRSPVTRRSGSRGRCPRTATSSPSSSTPSMPAWPGEHRRSGVRKRVSVLEGAGLDVLETLGGEGPFDAVFIDADKRNYDGYGRWAARNLRPGGLLLGDNAYLFGRLLEETAELPR